MSNSMTSIDNHGELPSHEDSLCDAAHREETHLEVEVNCGDEDALFVIAGQLREKVRVITRELGLFGVSGFGTIPAVTKVVAPIEAENSFGEPAGSAAVFVDDPDQT